MEFRVLVILELEFRVWGPGGIQSFGVYGFRRSGLHGFGVSG